MTNTSNSRVLNGVEQDQRFLPALEEGYFNVDEMSFEDLLTASVEFASSLTYYNLNLQPSGDWKAFLASNEIVIMASIINKNVDELRRSVQLPENQGTEALVAIIFDAILEIDKWLVDLARSNSSPAIELTSKLKGIIRGSLLEELHSVGASTERLRDSNDKLPVLNYRKLSDVWEVVEHESDEYQFPKSRSEVNVGQATVGDALRRSSFEFFNAIEHLKSICKDLLPLSLKTQSHDPAISLFITFLKLYKYAQDNVNSFTQRHLDYYYHEILRVQYKEKGLESVILNFDILSGSKPIEIKSGTRFTCASDKDLRDVEFCAAGDLSVNDAEVGELYTLKFEREEMITPECDMNFVTRIHKQKIPSALEQDVAEDESWPLFGDGVIRNRIEKDSDEAMEFGVAVASRALLLDEGFRKIKMNIGLSMSDKPISYYLEALVHSSSRGQFRQALFELMLAWVVDSQSSSWELTVPAELATSIEATASTLDIKDPPTMISATTGGVVEVESCASLLIDAIDCILDSDDVSLPFYKHLMHAESDAEFRDRLGALIVHCLLEDGSPEKLLAGVADNRARELCCESSLAAVKKEVRLGPERLFKKYFDTAFLLELSTDTGWLEIERYDVVNGDSDGIRLQIIASLPAEAPSIVGCSPEVHGSNWNTMLPLLKLKLNPEATINVFSLLEKYCIDTVSLQVEVTGARNIVAYNNISQLDPSKPFYPFGPIPTTSSYIAISAPEAAKKNIDSFRFHLHWGDLPQGEDGFDEHYTGYPSKIRNQSFAAKVSVLNNGSWQPQSTSQIQNAPLFSTLDKKLKEHQVINVNSIEHFRPIDVDTDDSELDLGLKTRNGFVKLTLSSPDAAFGHQEYPLRLTETLESNAKAKPKKKKNLPKAPYTPLLNKISIDYVASSVMSMNAPSGAHIENYSEKVFRLHPFGADNIYPNLGGGAVSLFKPFGHDGNLLLGISATDAQGMLSIYFSLSDDSERGTSNESTHHQWSYLTSAGWLKLEQNQIVSDGTKGFLCSGIITIDIPEDISSDHSDMPGSCFWLKISSNAASINFCSLHRVKTHALELVRSADDQATFDARGSQWSQLQWEPVRSIPGLESISQLDGFTEVDRDEQRRELVTRISERIRHRSRAVTPWDYERMVLERFPYVGKVLCLPNRSRFSSGTVPGNLLVVVTPAILNPEEVVGKTPKLSAVFLDDIHEYLSEFSSTFSTIEVINPSYEWVQVRCTTVFEKYASGGMFIDQLNTDIGRYLNLWDELGYGLKYCQTIKREDVYSYIYNLDYIKYVTDFSMLHITRDNRGQYDLGDTVTSEVVEGKSADVSPLYPWSLLVPLKRHYIEVSQVVEPKAAEVTGIRELEIGNTFIIGGM